MVMQWIVNPPPERYDWFDPSILHQETVREIASAITGSSRGCALRYKLKRIPYTVHCP